MPSVRRACRDPLRVVTRMKHRAHVFYSGRVQGVGFRLTAEETAKRFGVVGCVRNLRDGRVELIAEADREVLVQFLHAVRIGPMCNFIKEVDVTWSQPTGEYSEFEISYIRSN